MLRLIGIVISIGLADSLNPSTIAPALYLATGENARNRVAQFTAGVFAVYFLGGAAIAVGAGQLIRPLLPHPHHHITSIIEIAVGSAMIAAAAHDLASPGNARAARSTRLRPPGQVQLGPGGVDHRSRAADGVSVLRGDRGDRRVGPRPGARPRAADAVQRLLRAAAPWDRRRSSRSPATGPSRCSPRGGSSSSATGRRCSPDWRWSRDCSWWRSA